MNRHPHPLVAALAAAGLLLACLPASADTPTLLSDRQLSENYGQGLTMPVVAALASAEDAARVALPAVATSGDALSMAALSAAATANLERQLAEQQQQAGTVGLRQGIDLAGTVVNVARFQAVSAVTLPVLGLPFLFVPAMGMLPAMPSQQQNNNGNSNSSTGPGGH